MLRFSNTDQSSVSEKGDENLQCVRLRGSERMRDSWGGGGGVETRVRGMETYVLVF